MAKTVMLFGLGAVGESALQILACSEGVDRIVASSRNEVLGAFKTDTVALGATYQGIFKKYEFRKNDVSDIDATARLLEEVKPDVIFLVVSIKGPHILETMPLPQDIRERLLAAGFGAQLPWHLLLPVRFMQALEKSGIQTHVVNGSFPDVTSRALWNHFGFGPTVGMGNIDLAAARIIRHVSEVEGVPVREVMLYLVSSHAFLAHGSQEKVPFFAKIQLRDRDITSEYDLNQVIQRLGITTGSPEERQAAQNYFNFTIAASAVKNMMAIIKDTNEYTHAPAPNGLIGGYPVRLSAKGAEVILPKELTLEQAIKINEDAEKSDGIEKIKDDGTIVYTDKTYSIMKELGYDCKELSFDELESRGKELETLMKRLQNQGK